MTRQRQQAKRKKITIYLDKPMLPCSAPVRWARPLLLPVHSHFPFGPRVLCQGERSLLVTT